MFYKRSISLLVLILFVFSTAVFAQKNPQQNKKAQNIYMQYQQINQKLRGIQQKAFADKKIKKKSTKFRKDLKAEMIKEDSSMKGKLAKKDELLNDYKTASAKGNKKEMMAVKQKYQGLSRNLQAAQMKAMKNPKLMKERNDLKNALIAEMTKIEPKTPKLMHRLDSLRMELQQTRQQN